LLVSHSAPISHVDDSFSTRKYQDFPSASVLKTIHAYSTSTGIRQRDISGLLNMASATLSMFRIPREERETTELKKVRQMDFALANFERRLFWMFWMCWRLFFSYPLAFHSIEPSLLPFFYSLHSSSKRELYVLGRPRVWLANGKIACWLVAYRRTWYIFVGFLTSYSWQYHVSILI